MAECACCGSETELYSNGAPICLKCLVERDRRRKPDDGDPGFLNPDRSLDDPKRSGATLASVIIPRNK